MRIMDGPHERVAKPTYQIHVELSYEEVSNILSYLNYNNSRTPVLSTTVANVLNQMTKDIDLSPKTKVKVQHFRNTSGVVICDSSIPAEDLPKDTPICRACHDTLQLPGTEL